METKSDDLKFANAVITRNLAMLPPMLPPKPLDEVRTALAHLIRAARPRELLALRTLRHAFCSLARDNDGAEPQICPLLHKLASCDTSKPADHHNFNTGIAMNVAAGILLLFAHGMGQQRAHHDAPAACSGHDLTPKPLVILLGFAGGTPAALQRYADKLYHQNQDHVQVALVTASEVPEIFEHNIKQILRMTRGRPSWTIHLFSKAGFLTLAHLCACIREERLRQTAIQMNACVISARGSMPTPPRAIIWDSSPGSMSNYEEFIQGTWQSALLIAKRNKFTFSDAAKKRMDQLLSSSHYAESVRDSYAPMLSLSPFPFTGCKHCFIFQRNDPVSSAYEIKQYAARQIPAEPQPSKKKAVALLELGQGTHCDGLWWCGNAYLRAVRETLS
eukprot:g4878.t1